MEGFEASLRRGRLIEQALEHPPTHAHRAVVLAEQHRKLDRTPLAIPACVFRKVKKTIANSDLVLLLFYSLDGRGSATARCEMAVQGERIAGGFILITGIDGTRYAARQQAITVVHDADECRDETMIQLHGGHVVRVPCSLEEVLAWFV